MAMAMRPRQVPPLLAAALERARPGGALARVELHALSEPEARDLLGKDVDEATARRLYADCGGNPFYLEQLARHGGSAGANGAAGTLGALDVPPAVAASLAEELALLDPVARRVLEGAAVAGDPFEPELAAAAAGVSDAEAIGALDELLERDLIRQTDVPRRFRFRHPLVRGAVYAAAPAGWRLGAHERSADALAARGAPAASRAHHVEYAARHGDAEAIAVLAEAGREILYRTPAGAARWFAAALRLLPTGAPTEERVGLLLALAGALGATGRFDEARDAVLEGLALSPRDAAGQRLELIAACAWFDTLKGELARAQARLEAAIREHEDAPAAQAVQVMLLLSDNGIWRLDFERTLTWARRAHARAEQEGDSALVVASAAALAIGHAVCGDVAQGREWDDVAAATLDAMTDAELAPAILTLGQIGSAEYYLDRFAEGAAHSARTLEVARGTNQGQLFPMLAPVRGIFLAFLGRLDESHALLDAASEAGRLGGDSHATAWGLMARGMTTRQLGDLDAAIADARRASSSRDTATCTTSSPCSPGSRSASRCWSAERRARRPRRCWRTPAGPGCRSFPAPGAPTSSTAWSTPRWRAGARRRRRPRRPRRPRSPRRPGPLCPRWPRERAAARVAFDGGDPARPRVARWPPLRSPTVSARASRPRGRARWPDGRSPPPAGPTRRSALLQDAATALDACGARRYRDDAERELRRLGSRGPHRRTRAGQRDATGIESLTERELQVARLIVDRRTNPQIAAELFLCPKTVESHVRNLFHKLGVSSRVEVARVIERAGGGGPGTAGRTLSRDSGCANPDRRPMSAAPRRRTLASPRHHQQETTRDGNVPLQTRRLGVQAPAAGPRGMDRHRRARRRGRRGLQRPDRQLVHGARHRVPARAGSARGEVPGRRRRLRPRGLQGPGGRVAQRPAPSRRGDGERRARPPRRRRHVGRGPPGRPSSAPPRRPIASRARSRPRSTSSSRPTRRRPSPRTGASASPT